MAVRAKGRCSKWHKAITCAGQQPLRVYIVKPGQKSPLDAPYAWFTDVRDDFMAKDLGYYFLWERRDGQMSTTVSTQTLYFSLPLSCCELG